jgi:hypothetical protein
MKQGDTSRQGGWLDSRMADFDHRLKGILGEGRIRRREKRAKAEQAMQAVDDLIEGIADDLGKIDKSR